MSQIRGLANFIHDVRNCKTEDEERERVDKELAKIRECFDKPNVGSYALRKYMWKIMYMYILGYSIDFGHKQTLDLIRSNKFNDKNVGYIAVAVLLIEYTEMLRLCIQIIKNDLVSRNEIFQCLSLTCVANVGGPEFAETLMTDVQNLLISGSSRNFVRKKAALCLLRLLRQYPDNLPTSEAATEIIKLAKHRNVGVVTSVLSLLTGLATYDAANYESIVTVAIQLLYQLVIRRECVKEYIYYRTPDPWLQVKLLRILQYYPPPSDKSFLTKLDDILENIVTKTEVTPSVNKNHADHAILFEAINVIIHLNLHGCDMLHGRAVEKLLHFINVKEGNIRYLGLDAMARLAKIPTTHKLIKRHLRTIKYSLEDQDISIRKRALDLLYSICDSDNAVEIIEHLLRYLSKAEYKIREEMVLKIAILSEKFKSDYQWYVDIIFQLMTAAGEFVGEDVWFRVVQIVTNNENLQEYAAKQVYEHLSNPPVNESLLKIAAYILGEFGHLLTDKEGKDYFNLLQKHFETATPETKALLLSTYMKFINMYDDLAKEIVPIFEANQSSVDPEIQQRSIEYGIMAKYENQDLISQIWEAMPEFPDRESNLVKMIKGDKELQNVRSIDKDPFSDNENEEKKNSEKKNNDDDDDNDNDNGDDDDDNNNKKTKKNKKTKNNNNNNNDDDDGEENDNNNNNNKKQSSAIIPIEDKPQSNNQAPPSDDLLGDLFGGGTTTSGGPPDDNNNSSAIDIFGMDSNNNNNNNSNNNNNNIQSLQQGNQLLYKLFINDSSTLYEDNNIQIGLKTQVDFGGVMKALLYYGNKSTFTMNNVSLNITNQESIGNTITMQFSPNDAFNVDPKQQGHQKAKILYNSPTSIIPEFLISYNINNVTYNITGKFPVIATKFFQSHIFDAAQFKQRWTQLTKESKQVIMISGANSKTAISNKDVLKELLIKNFNIGLIDGVDNNPSNFVGCAVYHFATKKEDKNVTMPSLIRIEYNEAKQALRVTIRTGHQLASDAIVSAFTNIFEN